ACLIIIGALVSVQQRAAAQAANPQIYEVIPLKTLGTFAVGAAINDAGQIVGYSGTPNGIAHAALWSSATATPTDLGTMGGTDSRAAAITSSGAIVGTATIGGVRHAFLYQSGSMTDIGALGDTGASASGINDAGQIVGSSDAPGGGQSHGYLY